MPGFDNEQSSGRRIDQDFTKEEYRFKAKIISSEYKDYFTTLVNQYDFSQSCKIQLINIVNANFDPNAMLARNEFVEPRIIKFKIALNLAHVAMDLSDTQNPGLINIINELEDAFGDFVSRSIGGKEIDHITKTEMVSHQSYAGLPSNAPEQPEKRGFRLPWRHE